MTNHTNNIKSLLFALVLGATGGERADAQQPTTPVIDDGLGSAQSLRSTYTDATLYDQAMYLTAHNAYSYPQAGWKYYQQSLNFDEQFSYGVWAFMIDLHWCKDRNNNLYLAMAHLPQGSSNNYNYGNTANQGHLSSCLWAKAQRVSNSDIPSFESFLTDHAKKWLDNDKEAVITLHLESYTGSGGANDLHNLLNSTGVLSYVYCHISGAPWPTLGGMRQAGKRLVIFSDNKHDASRYISHTSEYKETLYNLAESSDCTLRSDNRALSKTKTILVMNHFYSLAYETNRLDYNQINNPFANSLGRKYITQGPVDLATRSEMCLTQEGNVTFIAADFVDEGECGGAREQVLRLNHKRLRLPPLPPSIISSNVTPQVSASLMDNLTIQAVTTTGWIGSWTAAFFKKPPYNTFPSKKALIFSGMGFGFVAAPTLLTFLPVIVSPIATGAVMFSLTAIAYKWACGEVFPDVFPDDNVFADSAFLDDI